MTLCENCNKETTNPRFCSRSCSAQVTNRESPRRNKGSGWKETKCIECNVDFEYHCSRSAGKYCSNACQGKRRNRKTVEAWKNSPESYKRITNSIKIHLREEAGNCCSGCGWNKKNPITGNCPLEIHHRDGNSENNTPENLQVLCPNCHSLTETWKALNKNTSEDRRMIFARYSDAFQR